MVQTSQPSRASARVNCEVLQIGFQSFGSKWRQFFGPNFVPNILKTLEERLRAGSKNFELLIFLEIIRLV